MTNKLTLTEQEELRQCEIRKARIALSMLQPLQRERLMKNRTFMQRKEIEKSVASTL